MFPDRHLDVDIPLSKQRRLMCGWPPTCKSFLREAQRSLAVMCAAFLCGRTWTAGLDGFRGSRPYQLVGI